MYNLIRIIEKITFFISEKELLLTHIKNNNKKN